MPSCSQASPELYPAFLKLTGRTLALVGGGPIAAEKLTALLPTGARLVVIAPDVIEEVERLARAHPATVTIRRRRFAPRDLDRAWYVVAAATPDVNRTVARAANARRIFVNAVDDPANASAYAAGVVRKAGVTIAVSTEGRAPALAGLLREALESVLPPDLARWVTEATGRRAEWKRRGTPMKARRPLLLRALNRIYRAPESPAESGPRRGMVSLVGAGPGDAGLLTRRAADRLRTADLVLYDALVDSSVLRLAGRAQKFFVGKRAGRHAVRQETIHRLLIDGARRGKCVVRLKGGDPFVLGRGGEEALALAAAGTPFEIVPGVSAAIAAPALAGIPVTHRGLASGFVVVSGHHADAYEATLGAIPAGRMTIVVLMGLAARGDIATVLIRRGWPPSTPAAIVSAASSSTGSASRWLGALGGLGAAEIPDALPGTIVIGATVALAARLVAQTRDEHSLRRSHGCR